MDYTWQSLSFWICNGVDWPGRAGKKKSIEGLQLNKISNSNLKRTVTKMDVIKDKRFAGIVKDPRFKKVPNKQVKAEVDKRFLRMFHDKQFDKKFLIDKRGSPLDHKVSEDIKKFYDFKENKQDVQDESATSDEEEDKHKKDEDDKEPKSDDSDSSTTTDTDLSEDEQEEEIDHRWCELDADAPRSSNITRRLALCNMDWDRLRAEDFLVVFNSFKPPDGVINSIKIYPSEYGLECIKKEKLYGPAELIEEKLDSDEDISTSRSKGSRFHQEKLRQYQINRLKYFYAVIDCDSVKTADTLYDQLNGIQFENSGCILDLRFIPDDMTFEQEPVSVASSLACPSDYKPVSFVTSALNQIKVDLTWDETDPRRKEVLEKAFTDPESIEKDLKEYLASPSESEDEVEELEDKTNSSKLSSKEAIAKYRELLQALEDKEKGKAEDEEFDMEITWEPGLKEKTEKLVKEKVQNENLTPFEEKLQKKKKDLKNLKKERKLKSVEENDDDSNSEESGGGESGDDEQEKKVASKGRKKNKLNEDCEADEKKVAELALLMADPDEKNSSDSDDPSEEQKEKKKKKKKKKKMNKPKEEKEESFMEPIDDPRFAAIYTNHLFHIDPSDPKFKERKKQRISTETMQRENHDDFSPVISSHEIPKKEGSKAENLKSVKIEALKKKLKPFCKNFQKKKEVRKSEGKRNGDVQKIGNSTAMNETCADTSCEVSNSEKKKKKKVKKLEFPVEGDSAFMADISNVSVDTSVENGICRKRKKQKMLQKQGFSIEEDCTFMADTSPQNSSLERRKVLQKVKKKHFVGDNSHSQNSSANATLFNDSAVYFGEADDSDILIFSSSPVEKQTSKSPSKNHHLVNPVRKKMKKCNPP